MADGSKVVFPVYHQIALDVAYKIANGKFSEGQRIRGRSSLAGQYSVSPETIRRAMALLQDMGIVEIRAGVGIEVLSAAKAVEFVDKFREIESFTSLQEQIETLMDEINEKYAQLQKVMAQLVDSTERARSKNPFLPYELRAEAGDFIVGKTISEVAFWPNTRATIIAVKRGEQTILSPGPHLEFREGDIIVLVGDEASYNRSKLFIQKG